MRAVWCGVLAWALVGGAAQAQEASTDRVHLQGAGATFPSKVYDRWMARFQQAHPQARVSYRPTGSGDGIRQAKARAVQWAGTDSPLSAAELAEHRLVQIPMLIGGLVPVVQLKGVAPQALVLSGAVLAEIMLGQVSHWDDPRIAALNPRLKLPHLPVQRVVRDDASGSSDIFSRYLARVSPEFAARVVPSQKPLWPAGDDLRRGKGNDGVVSVLRDTPGGITYVSFDRVAKDGLTAVRLLGHGGQAVAASPEAFKAAILASDVYRQGDDQASLLDLPRPDAWPITATSFVLLDARPKDLRQAQWSARFVHWCFSQGDDLTRGTGFAPLPSRVQARLVGRLGEIKGPRGEQPGLSVF